MFVVKKFISQFLMPIPLVAVIFLTGWLCVRFSRFRRIGKALIGSAIGLFLLFGYGIGTERYLYRLERSYPSVELNAAGVEQLRGGAIVVLGQGMAKESDLAFRYQTGPSFQMRLQEGVRLYRKIPEAQMFISLAGETDIKNKERFLDEYAREHSLKRERMHLIAAARDTSDEARIAIDLAKTNRFVVVTSASHLLRASKIFSKELTRRKVPNIVVPGGVLMKTDNERPSDAVLIPAPCDYLVASKPVIPKFRLWALPLPSVDGFSITQHALYEWLGNLYEDLME